MRIIHLDQMLESKGQVSLCSLLNKKGEIVFSPKLKCFYNKELL